MGLERFILGQRRSVNCVFALFVSLVTFMWLATLLDQSFDMEWGWDRQILWLAPPMVLFALLVRFCAMAVFKFVGRNP
jgi:hypothetical protein